MEFEPVSVNGHDLICPVCQCNEFMNKRVLLNTAGMTLLKLDWANREANCYICRDCGYIFWFAD
jgi:predicted nucleic-acid-binding Zn-ribbon protein